MGWPRADIARRACLPPAWVLRPDRGPRLGPVQTQPDGASAMTILKFSTAACALVVALSSLPASAGSNRVQIDQWGARQFRGHCADRSAPACQHHPERAWQPVAEHARWRAQPGRGGAVGAPQRGRHAAKRSPQYRGHRADGPRQRRNRHPVGPSQRRGRHSGRAWQHVEHDTTWQRQCRGCYSGLERVAFIRINAPHSNLL